MTEASYYVGILIYSLIKSSAQAALNDTRKTHGKGKKSHGGVLFLHHLMRTGCAATSNSAVQFIKQHSYYTHHCERVDFCHCRLIFNHHLLRKAALAAADFC